MDLTTAARVRALLEGGGISQASLDTLITQAITEVSALVERLLDRQVLVAAVVETLDVEPLAGRFRLRAFPVTAWTDARHDVARAFGSDTVLPATAYAREDERGWLVLDQYELTPGPQVLRLSYTGGMAASTAAFISAYPDIAGAVDRQVASLVQRRHSLTAQAVNAGTMGASFQGAYDELAHLRGVLREHKR